MKFNFSNLILAAATMTLLNCFPNIATAQTDGATNSNNLSLPPPIGYMPGFNFPYGGPYGAPPFPNKYYNYSGITDNNYGSGMIITDPKRAITPRLSGSPIPEETTAKIAQLYRDRIATSSTLETLRSHMAQHRATIAALSTKLHKAQAEKKPTDEIQAQIAFTQSENKLFAEALKDSTKSLKSVDEALASLAKKQTTDNSQGWVIVEIDKDPKQEQPLKCSSGQRLVSKNSYGSSSFGCLDSKGFLMKESNMIITQDKHNYSTTTIYDRDGANIKSITNLGADGKPLYEQTFATGQETHKYFDKGTMKSSCTYYGDAASRNIYGSPKPNPPPSRPSGTAL